MSLAPGQFLNNRYQIIGLLGQGGMGSVYRAYDQTLSRNVALKERHPDPNATPAALAQARTQFQREAKVLANLTHPNLPRVTDYFSFGGNEYLVMDFVEGKSLDQVIQQQGALPEVTVLAWANQLLAALEYIHTRSIIHRDIKPQNIILAPDGHVILVDFGLVKLLDPNDPRTLTALRGMGTPEYAPLEQYATGVGHTDARSDLYSFGATLYHLLTGRAPVEVHQRLLNPATLPAPRAVNPKVSAQTEAAVQKAMEVYPQNRFQIAAEMRQALTTRAPTQVSTQHVIQPRVQTTSPAYTQPIAPTAPTRNWLAPVLGIGVILIVCLFGLMMFMGVVLSNLTASPAAPPTAIARATSPLASAPTAIASSKFECKDRLGCTDIAPNQPIHIAYLFVTAGENATLGLDTKYGAEIAVDDAGGKILGHPIKFDGQDSGCSADGGQAAALKVAADKTVVAVIGTNCSSEARVAAPILLTQTRIAVMISPSNTSPDLTDPAKHVPGYFRTSHNDKVQGMVAAQFAATQLKVGKAATIHDGSIYASGLVGNFVDAFRNQYRGTITVQETVNVGDRDMRPVLTRIAASKPDLIYFPIFVSEGGFICAQMRDVPGLEKTVMLGADGLFSPDFLKACGKNVTGMYFSSPNFSAFGPGYSTLVQKYLRKYNIQSVQAPFHAHAYDAMNMILAALQKPGVTTQDPDGTLHVQKQALRDAIAATKDFQGITGNLTCDPNGDCADPKIAIYQTTADNLTRLTMPYNPIWQPK